MKTRRVDPIPSEREQQPVYRFQLARDVPNGLAWLGPSEREHLATLRIAKRRDEWLMGRWAAKQAVSGAPWVTEEIRQLGDLEILPTATGAPRVILRDEAAPWAVSVSHRAGAALCVVVEAGSVGCDLEWIEERSAAFVRDYFTSSEQAWMKNSSAADGAVIANALWSAKESVLKVLGVGLRVDTRSLTVHTSEPPGTRSWQPLAVEFTPKKKVYRGWWRQQTEWVLTMITDPQGPPPSQANPGREGG